MSATVIDPTVDVAHGAITGTVDDGDEASSDATVEAISVASGATIASSQTSAIGAYALDDLPTGEYRIRVQSPTIAPTYAPSASTTNAAEIYTVASGETVAAPVTVTSPGSLSGRVTAGGTPVPGIRVAAATLSPHESVAAATTDADGRFTIGGLPPTGLVLALVDPQGRYDAVIVGAVAGDPDSGIVYSPVPGEPTDVGTIDLAAGGRPSLAITTADLADAYVGVPDFTALEAVGGDGDVNWAATGLPAGMELDSSGVIIGTPTVPGTASVSLTATDGRGMVAARTLPFTVHEGLPAECVLQDCSLVELRAGTVELPGDLVAAVERGAEGTPVAATLSPAAPAVSVGQILAVDASDRLPSGAFFEVQSVEALDDGGQHLAVSLATPGDAYENAAISSGAEPAEGSIAGPAPADAAGRAATQPCGSSAEIEVTPEVDADLNPSATVMVGDRWGAWGIAGKEVTFFNAQVHPSITVRVRGEISGKVSCRIPVNLPSVRAGLAWFDVSPSFEFGASGAVSVDMTMRLQCHLSVNWVDGALERRQSTCDQPTPPQVRIDGEADVWVRPEIAMRATVAEIFGIEGRVGGEVRLRYRSAERPQSSLTARVDADVNACIACFVSGSFNRVTLYDGTLYSRTLGRWGNLPSEPCRRPVSGVWSGTWSSSALGLSGTWSGPLSFGGGAISGSVDITGATIAGGPVTGSYDCNDLSFGWVDNDVTFDGSLTDDRTASGAWSLGSQDLGLWEGSRTP